MVTIQPINYAESTFCSRSRHRCGTGVEYPRVYNSVKLRLRTCLNMDAAPSLRLLTYITNRKTLEMQISKFRISSCRVPYDFGNADLELHDSELHD